MALKSKKQLKNTEDYVINGVKVFVNLKAKEMPEEDSYLLNSPARKKRNTQNNTDDAGFF